MRCKSWLGLYACMHVCMYACMYACTYACMWVWHWKLITYIHTCIYTHVLAHILTYVYMHLTAHGSITGVFSAALRATFSPHTHTYTPTKMHILKNAHTYIQTYICVHASHSTPQYHKSIPSCAPFKVTLSAYMHTYMYKYTHIPTHIRTRVYMHLTAQRSILSYTFFTTHSHIHTCMKIPTHTYACVHASHSTRQYHKSILSCAPFRATSSAGVTSLRWKMSQKKEKVL